MRHYGDITKLKGGELPVVDVITGGSPCQGLSIAGKRAGLDDERSGLFLHQIRIIREIRNAEKASGRTGEYVRPRFCVWEQVPGAFSSNDREDFRCVLSEFVRVAEPQAPDVPLPDKKWPGAGLLMGDGWSIAWRVLDAQFWGVPQRRRRIALVADFGGRRAGEILFEREGITGNQDASGEARESASSGAGGGDRLPDCASGGGGEERRLAGNDWCYPETARSLLPRMAKVECLNPSDPQSERVYSADGLYPSLQANSGGGQSRSAVLCYDARGNGNGKTCPTLTGDHENRVTDYSAIALCVGNGQTNNCSLAEVANTLDTMHDQQAVLSVEHTGVPFQIPVVRRLTPLEAERLQAFPDGWTDVGDYIGTDGKHRKTSDTARYAALGNSIALPQWEWLARRIVAEYDRPATMGSLFDGIAGFPLVFQRAGATPMWASEISEFAIAVSKAHFPEEGGIT